MTPYLRLLLISLFFGIGTSSMAFQVNWTVVHAACGNPNGSITLFVSGPGPYTYFWVTSPPTGQGTPSATGLAPGSYTIEVTDVSATTVSVTVDVLNLPGLDMTAALNASIVLRKPCPGQCDGELVFNTDLLGGLAPYTINTVPAMPLDALCGNTPFDINITDAAGCTGSITTVMPEVEYPTLLGTLLNGACPGAPTSVEAFFDQDAMFTIAAPDGSIANGMTGPHGGIAISAPNNPGVYWFNYTPYPPCPTQNYAVTFPAMLTDCSDVEGFLYVDVNGNCVQDATDFPLTHAVVTVNPGGYSTMTDMLGHYQLQVPYGTYDLTYTDPVYTQSCAVPSPVNFTVDVVTPSVTIDLPLTPGPDPDITISCAFGQAVPGFVQDLWITVTNNGGVPSGPINVTLDHDLLLTYTWYWICIVPPGPPVVLPYPTSVTPGQLVWDIPEGLDPTETRTLVGRLGVPPDPLLIGTGFNYTATANTTLTDANPADNVCTHTEIVVGSFDPNDKTARTTSGSSSEWSVDNDSLLTYTIRFQNTGTAPAINVVLVDTLSADIDLATLKILGASHMFSIELEDRILTFTFDHIMLPDSNTNEAGSHGFAQFSIQPVGMEPGDSVSNLADIYFDFNPAIRTNTSVVTAPFPFSIPEYGTNELNLFPNPTTGLLSFRTSGKVDAVVSAMDGRVVRSFPGNFGSVDIGGLAQGTYTIRVTDVTTGEVLGVEQFVVFR